MTEVNIQLEPFQGEFLKSTAMFPAMVSAWGTGKSMCLILKAMYLSEEYPGNLGVVFRKEFSDLKDSTCKDFEDLTGLKINSHRDVVLPNGSRIMFRHIEELNNIQNINLGWFAIEQAEELDSDNEFFTLFGRLRRKDCGIPQGIIVANSKGHNWIWKLWKVGGLEGVFEELPEEMKKEMEEEGVEIGSMVEATTYDNIHNLPDSFRYKIEILKTKKPKLYNRMVMNSWEDDDIEDVVIQRHWIEEAGKREVNFPAELKVVACDPARFGDDETVIYALENTDIVDEEIYRKKNTMDTAARIHRMVVKHKASVAVIEVVGLAGAGIADRLRELAGNDYMVLEVNPAHRKKGEVPAEYYNRRSQLWLEAGEKFENGEIMLTWEDDILKEELSTPKYIFRTGRQYVLGKDKIKKEIGKSPDRATAYILAIHGLQYAAETEYKGRKRPSWEEYWGKKKAATAMSV